MATLDESFAARPRVLVFATTCDKDVRGMLRALVGRFERIIFTRYQNNPRGLPAAELAALAAELGGAALPGGRRSTRPPGSWPGRWRPGRRADRDHRQFFHRGRNAAVDSC